MVHIRGPHPLVCGPVPVRGLAGTSPWRWVSAPTTHVGHVSLTWGRVTLMQGRVTLAPGACFAQEACRACGSPIPAHGARPPNQSTVPKRLGTTGVVDPDLVAQCHIVALEGLSWFLHSYLSKSQSYDFLASLAIWTDNWPAVTVHQISTDIY